jgi:mRNA interferase RelE/StbE
MYTVVLDELVFEKDFKRIDKSGQKKIVRAIRNKLATRPKEFGEPLSSAFSGLWKLRLGRYRIIYEIEEDKVHVYVVIVGFKRNAEVYKKLISRLKLR